MIDSRCLPLIVWLGLLSGCNTYSAPSGATASNMATLMGSTHVHPGLFAHDLKAQAQSIDGHGIMFNGAIGPQRMVLVPPGPHKLEIGVNIGTTAGSTPVDVTLQPGVVYTVLATEPFVHANADGQTADWPNESLVWIASPAGPVTRQIPVYLERPQPGPIPIILFIPVK